MALVIILIKAGTSRADVFVIILFSTFVSVAQGGGVQMLDFMRIPVSIVLGILYGAGTGLGLARFFVGSYRIGQQWEIEIYAIQRNVGGQSHWVKYGFMIQNRELRITGSSHLDEFHNDPIAEVLQLACP